ncbi:MAG TPA: TA system VapC family ribonuclease toxin [Propionibacteriaceae bacterium]|nr:TA system VapC family ribonuclease toxin [Propionibacteriaceae bacterium]
MRYLLDANVLIALTVQEHEHHERASIWASTVDSFATCPVVEGALVRFLVRLGESAITAVEVIQRIRNLPAGEFWPDSISYADIDLGHVVGHRQVTDAYLVNLAGSHAATLATLDEGLASLLPDHTFLLPESRRRQPLKM